MKIDFKTQRHIMTVVWGMIFCFNLVICLSSFNAHPISWIMVGLALGCFLHSLITNPLLNVNEGLFDMQDKIIHSLRNSIDEYSNIITKLNEGYSKKSTKGGKKKK